MKLFKKMKDGGPESNVTGYWLIESKKYFSVVLLKFNDGSREAYHSHAFNAVSWILSGIAKEDHMDGSCNWLVPSFLPVYTPRHCFHKVTSCGTTWALTFRGPWSKEWKEYLPESKEEYVLTSGRIRKVDQPGC